jgi:hypothetical protein
MDPNATTAEAEAKRLSREQQLPVYVMHDAIIRLIRCIECTPRRAAELLRRAHLLHVATPAERRPTLEQALNIVMAHEMPLVKTDERGRLVLLLKR